MRNRTETAYIVYQPRYTPGDGYRNYRNKQRAFRAALQMGDGTRIYRSIDRIRKLGRIHRIEPGWEVFQGTIKYVGMREPSHDSQERKVSMKLSNTPSAKHNERIHKQYLARKAKHLKDIHRRIQEGRTLKAIVEETGLPRSFIERVIREEDLRNKTYDGRLES